MVLALSKLVAEYSKLLEVASEQEEERGGLKGYNNMGEWPIEEVQRKKLKKEVEA